jgi:hypothetical protein
VPHPLLQRSERHLARRRHAGAEGVSEVVETDDAHAGALARTLKALSDVGAIERLAGDGMAEHQIVVLREERVPPQFAKGASDFIGELALDEETLLHLARLRVMRSALRPPDSVAAALRDVVRARSSPDPADLRAALMELAAAALAWARHGDESPAPTAPRSLTGADTALVYRI